MLIMAVELGIEISIDQMLDDVIDGSFFIEPAIEYFMAHPDSECVYTQELFGLLVK